ncbi:hypothetical protein NLI96_g1727 [Meripilus lineatus]|uniref:Uncharacterized protein n=1 Tax=Meripilus lineatus TaxID=2056292 RepID=A0AAD5YKP5_9APHY|nr:hypothetical protein NLI96_g1727 [Physisporinus lineatus]
MSEVVHSAEIYAQELSHFGYGRPMWSPELPLQGIELGDVGVIVKGEFISLSKQHSYTSPSISTGSGAFHLLFNIVAGKEARNHYGVPGGFVPLVIDDMLEEDLPDFLPPKPLGSRSVTVTEGDVSVSGGVPIAGAGINYTCTWKAKAGAVLQMAESADMRSIISNRLCPRYMDQHYDSWCQFAESKGLALDAADIEGPILIRGWVKTSGWALTAWSSKSGNQSVKIQANALESANVALSLSFLNETQTTPVNRVGPKLIPGQTIRPRSQVVFLTRYRMKLRSEFLGLRFGAITSDGSGRQERPYYGLHRQTGPGGAGPSGSQGSQGGGDGWTQDGGNQVTRSDFSESPIDPVEELLDYILEHSEVDRAIACEGDLRDVLNMSPNQKEYPQDIKAELSRIAPIIDTYGNNTGSVSIEEIVFKAHPPQGPPAIPPEAREHSSAGGGHAVGEQVDDSGTLTIGKSAEDRRTIRWPHTIFTEIGADTGIPCTPAISLDGQILAAGYEDTCVRLYNIEEGHLTLTLTGHEGTVRCVAFSPENTFLVSGSVDGSIIVWRVQSGLPFKTLDGHKADIWSLAVSPDGEDVASGSADSTVKFWKLMDDSAMPFETGDGHMTTVQAVAYTSDSTYLVSCAADSGRIYSREGNRIADMSGHEGIIYSLDISHRGYRAITGSEDNTARVWKIETGEELVTIRQHNEPVWSARFTSDDKRVICGSYDRTVSVHDSYSGELYFLLQGNVSFVESVAYFPRGDMIASGATDGIVLLWNAKTGEQIALLKCHFDKVTSMQSSPDQEHLITSSDDGTIRALNILDIIRVS